MLTMEPVKGKHDASGGTFVKVAVSTGQFTLLEHAHTLIVLAGI
jgi:hypothetical protein